MEYLVILMSVSQLNFIQPTFVKFLTSIKQYSSCKVWRIGLQGEESKEGDVKHRI